MQASDGFFHPILWVSLASMGIAQVVKPFWDLALGKPFRVARIFDTGGMPSSHTALVTTLAIAIGAVEGTSSSVFSVVLIFSLYFVFEATGLRQEVGHQAKLLNEMVDELVHEHHVKADPRRLRELVGHTWTEVLAGGGIGVVVFFLLRSYVVGG